MMLLSRNGAKEVPPENVFPPSSDLIENNQLPVRKIV